ncbi:hypothetical protein ACEPAI_8358 [Sanghuangporus weigelae]
MNIRSMMFAVIAFVATAAAAPNPSPLDADTAHIIAMNNNLACSTGSCNSTVLETNSTSTVPYTSGVWGRRDTWSPLTLFAVGGLAFSTGML